MRIAVLDSPQRRLRCALLLALCLLLAACEMPAGGETVPTAPEPVAVTVEVSVVPATEPAALTVTVMGAVVNLREGPSLDHPIRGQVQPGAELPVTGISADRQWLQVARDEARLWLAVDQTDLEAPQRAALPVVAAPAGPELSPELVCLGPDGRSPDLTCDKQQLLVLRDDLRGANTTVLRNWQAATPIAEFAGVVVEGTPPRVVALEWDVTGVKDVVGAHVRVESWVALPFLLHRLPQREYADNQLRGTVPPILHRLTHLQILSLHGNELTGPIPRTLAQLPYLQSLDLSYNRLTGPVPPELAQLPRLQGLNLAANRLTGPIPPELAQLAQLAVLIVGDNHLTGPVPPELGQLQQLRWLSLSLTGLTGAIPPELGQLSQLTGLDLNEIGLTGCIPSELGQLQQLLQLHLRENNLTGVIPAELGQLSHLILLDIRYNDLMGCIPPALDPACHCPVCSCPPLPLCS